MGIQYLYYPEFAEYVQNFYFSVNFKPSGLNHRKHTGTQDDINRHPTPYYPWIVFP